MEVENWVQAAQSWTSCGASDAQKRGDCYAKFAAIAAAGRQLTFEVITTLTALGWLQSHSRRQLNGPGIHSPEHQWNVPNQMNLFTCFPLEAQHFWFVSG